MLDECGFIIGVISDIYMFSIVVWFRLEYKIMLLLSLWRVGDSFMG